MADAKLVLEIVADASNAARQLDKTGDKAKSFGNKVKAGAKVGAVALLAVAGAAVSFAKAAADDAQGAALLSNALKKNAGASKAQVAQTEALISKLSLASGVADDELRPSMATLTRATGSVTKSQAALKQALDISAATGKPVALVSKAIAKGYGGSAASLAKLVPGLDAATVASGDMTAIMAELAKKTGGASAAAADTAAGKMQRLKIAMQETKESVGAALLPAMGAFATVLGTVAVFLGKHPALLKILAIAIVVVATAMIALNVALTIMAAAEAAVLLPVLAVVAAIALLTAGFILAYRHSSVFRAVVQAVFAAVKLYVMTLVKVLTTEFKIAWAVVSVAARVVGVVVRAVFGAIRTAIGFVVGAAQTLGGWFGRLKIPGALRAVLDLVRAGVVLVIGVVDRLVGWFGRLKVPGAVSGTFDAIRGAVQKVIDAVQTLIGWIGRIHIPHLPAFLGGSSINRAMFASGPTDGVSTVSRAAGPGVSFGSSGGGGGVTVVNVYGALDPEGVARQIGRLLGASTMRNGTRGLRVA